MVTERGSNGKSRWDWLSFIGEGDTIVLWFAIWVGYTTAIAMLYEEPGDFTWAFNRAGILAIIPTLITARVWKYFSDRRKGRKELEATIRRHERELEQLRRERDESDDD